MRKPIIEDLLGEDGRGPYLMGAQCEACGFVTLRVREICPACWEREAMQSLPIGRSGKLYSWTVIHQAPPGFHNPFAVGYVDVEAGVRVFAHVAMDASSLRIGARLHLTTAELAVDPEGIALIGPRYVAG